MNLKIILRLLLVIPIGFWITTLNVWVFPQILIDVGIENPSVLSFIMALGIMFIDCWLIFWAISEEEKD